MRKTALLGLIVVPSHAFIDWQHLDVQVINLESRWDRLLDLELRVSDPSQSPLPFSLENMCRMPAVNASEVHDIASTGLISDDDWAAAQQRVEDNVRTFGGPLTPGAVGCGLSHALAWKRIVDLDLPYGLIMEDDTRVFYAHLEQAFKQDIKLPADWRLVQLQACVDPHKKSLSPVAWWTEDEAGGALATIEEVRVVLKRGVRTCLGAYLINRDGAQYLLENALPLREQIDANDPTNAFARMPGHYYTYPPLARQYKDSKLESDDQIQGNSSSFFSIVSVDVSHGGGFERPIRNCKPLPGNTSHAGFLGRALGAFATARRHRSRHQDEDQDTDWKVLLNPELVDPK